MFIYYLCIIEWFFRIQRFCYDHWTAKAITSSEEVGGPSSEKVVPLKDERSAEMERRIKLLQVGFLLDINYLLSVNFIFCLTFFWFKLFFINN